MNEQKIEQALEMARCADYNMDNLASWQPSVTSNPMFIMVRAQLRSAIDLHRARIDAARVAERRANRRCAALWRSVQRPEGARLSAGLELEMV